EGIAAVDRAETVSLDEAKRRVDAAIARGALQREISIGLKQAEDGEFSSRSVDDIAADVLAEDDDFDLGLVIEIDEKSRAYAALAELYVELDALDDENNGD